VNNEPHDTESEVQDGLHYATRIDLIRDLVQGYQLLQMEFHRAHKKEILIERVTHFIKALAPWSNFGFTWFDPETGLFDFGEIFHETEKIQMENLLNELIESGTFASSLQMSRVAVFPFHHEFVVLTPIRAGQEIKGVFVGLTRDKVDQNREFEFHFLNLGLNSLGAAVKRVESSEKFSANSENLGELILKKVSESEEARMFAEATTRRMSDFFNLFHNEVYNSLNGVLGFTQLMMESVVSEEQRENLEFILKSGEHLKIITVEAQRPRAVVEGVLSVDLKSVDMRRLWDYFTKTIHESLKERNRVVSWDSSIPVAFRLTLDEVRLRQILYSLADLIFEAAPGSPLMMRARYQEFRDEFIFTFESDGLTENRGKFDFTVYAAVLELLKLGREVRAYSFGICRSIAKFEGWILEWNATTDQKSEIVLRINVSGRSKYE
jgi:signal transduction histidine kinase